MKRFMLVVILFVCTTFAYSQKSICGVDFGSSYESAKSILERKFGEAASYGHNEIWYRDKTYAGLVFDDIYFGFQADINRTYFNKCFFVREEKNVQSCKHFLRLLLSKLKVKYDTEMHEELDENGFLFAWGGHSPISEEDIGFRVFVVKDKIYQIFLTYGDYDYINEEF